MTATARADRGRSADGQVLGALLVLGGVGWLLQRSGLVEMSWETTLAALLVALGAGMVVTVRRRGGSGLVVLGIAMTAVLASTSSLDIGALKGGVGDRASRPTTLAQARAESSLGIGSLHVTLADLPLADGETRLNYRIGIGELNIVLPSEATEPGVKVKVIANVKGGDLDVLGQRRSGQDIKETFTEAGFTEAKKQLVINVSVVFGNVQVDRAPF